MECASHITRFVPVMQPTSIGMHGSVKREKVVEGKHALGRFFFFSSYFQHNTETRTWRRRERRRRRRRSRPSTTTTTAASLVLLLVYMESICRSLSPSSQPAHAQLNSFTSVQFKLKQVGHKPRKMNGMVWMAHILAFIRPETISLMRRENYIWCCRRRVISTKYSLHGVRIHKPVAGLEKNLSSWGGLNALWQIIKPIFSVK